MLLYHILKLHLPRCFLFFVLCLVSHVVIFRSLVCLISSSESCHNSSISSSQLLTIWPMSSSELFTEHTIYSSCVTQNPQSAVQPFEKSAQHTTTRHPLEPQHPIFNALFHHHSQGPPNLQSTRAASKNNQEERDLHWCDRSRLPLSTIRAGVWCHSLSLLPNRPSRRCTLTCSALSICRRRSHAKFER